MSSNPTEPNFDFQKNPFENFLSLFSQAEKSVLKDVNAMSLATVDSKGKASLRTVLYKGLLHEGFSFYTNYSSQKGQELLNNDQAALLFFWSALDQQVRIEGIVKRLSEDESDAYFNSRPRVSQIGAWASAQSQKISGPEELQKKVQSIEEKYQGQPVPRPPHWGGLLLQPMMIEFWFGRTGRLHDRYVYERSDLASSWTRYMKSP